MSIEEQIVALEARIQQCLLSIANATETAESAASRAELAAQRAELAALGSQQAEVASVVAAEISAAGAATSVEAVEEVQAIAEEIEMPEAVEEEVEEHAETEESEVPVQLQPGGEEDATGEPGLQSEPIIIKVETSHRKEPGLFKRNNTRFRRGRAS